MSPNLHVRALLRAMNELCAIIKTQRFLNPAAPFFQVCRYVDASVSGIDAVWLSVCTSHYLFRSPQETNFAWSTDTGSIESEATRPPISGTSVYRRGQNIMWILLTFELRINPTTRPERGCGYHRRNADKAKTTNFLLVSSQSSSAHRVGSSWFMNVSSWTYGQVYR